MFNEYARTGNPHLEPYIKLHAMKPFLRNLLPALFILLFQASTIYAGSTDRIDSLKMRLDTMTGACRIDVLLALSQELREKDFNQALSLAEEALNYSRNYKKGDELGTAHYTLGYLSHSVNDFVSAVKHYKKALPIFENENNLSQLADTYSQLGALFQSKSDYEQSLENYSLALDLFGSLRDSLNMGLTSIGMANSLSNLGQRNKALEVLNNAKPMISDKPYWINYYMILGDLYTSSGDHQIGLDAFYQAAEICIAINDMRKLAMIYEYLAETYFELSIYDKSAEYYFQTIALNKKLNIPDLIADSYLGLGKLYAQWKDFPKAMDFFNNAIFAAAPNQDKELLAESHQGLGACYAQIDQLDKSLYQFEKALSISEEIKNLDQIIDSRISIGEIYLAQKEFAKAEQFLLATIALIPKDWNQKCLLASLYDAIGNAHLNLRQLKQSEAFFNEGFEFAKACSNREKQVSYLKSLIPLYSNLGHHKRAMEYQQQLSDLQLELVNKKNNKAILAFRTEYETEEKEKEIELLQKERELQALKLENQQSVLSRRNSFLILLASLLVSVLLLSYLIFNRFKLKQRADYLEAQNRQIALEQAHFKVRKQLEMNELRTNFFTDISHEIRTPLSLILSPVRDLLQSDNNYSYRKKAYQLIQRNAERLLELVNQALDFSKMESGHFPLHFENCKLDDLLGDIAQKFDPLFKEKNIRFEFISKAKNPYCSCDKDKIEKAVSNLLSNAIKYTRKGGMITMRLRDEIIKESDFRKNASATSNLNIEVQDNGIGIAAENHELIFERYATIDKDSSLNGAGIGLALTKKIVELHKGKITVKSSPGKGSTFQILMPGGQVNQEQVKPSHFDGGLAEVEQVPLLSKSISSPSIEKEANEFYDILVVEDHADLRSYIFNKLSDVGYKVAVAKNGEEAILQIENLQPELVISDVMMPGLNGFELLKRLKNNPSTSHLPVILLTAKATIEDLVEGLEIGADDYLIKPFRIDELILRCKNLIEQRRKMRKSFLQNPKSIRRQTFINSGDKKFLERTMKLVEENIDDGNFTVERLCQELWMSRSNVFNKIKSLTGQNISEFIRTIRLKAAAEMMETDQKSIADIRMSVGFNNRQSFNKAFKNHFGVTPTQFKKGSVKADVKRKSGPELAPDSL